MKVKGYDGNGRPITELRHLGQLQMLVYFLRSAEDTAETLDHAEDALKLGTLLEEAHKLLVNQRIRCEYSADKEMDSHQLGRKYERTTPSP